MPTFDVVSQVDLQEVRNAVDQAARETATRYDFKGTDTTVDLGEGGITLESSTEQRLEAAVAVIARAPRPEEGVAQGNRGRGADASRRRPVPGRIQAESGHR